MDYFTLTPDIIDIIVEEIDASSTWANENHEELVEMLAPILNIDEASIKKSVERRIYGVEEITKEIVNEQQEIADIFYELDIIPKELDVRDAMK